LRFKELENSSDHQAELRALTDALTALKILAETTCGPIEMKPRRRASPEARMSDYKAGDRVKIQLTGGRLVDAEIKAIIETTQGKRLQVSFGEETARIYLWQVVEKLR